MPLISEEYTTLCLLGCDIRIPILCLIGKAANTSNCITFIQRRPNVFDAGPTLYKWYTISCVYWEYVICPRDIRSTVQCPLIFLIFLTLYY